MPPAPTATSRLRGATTRVWGGPLSIAGELELTDDTVRFRPSGALGPLLRQHRFELPLTALRGMAWRSGRKRLALEAPEDEILLEGGVVARLAACLAVMGVPFADAPDLAAFGLELLPLIAHGRATHRSGPVHHPGWLAAGGRGLAFEYAGLVEQLAGFEGRWMPIERLHTVSAEGRTLTLDDGEDPFVVQVDDPGPWTAALGRWMASHPLPWDADLSDATLSEADAPLLSFDGVWQDADGATLRRGKATLWRVAGLAFTALDGSVVRVSPAQVQQAVYGRLSDDASQALGLRTEEGGRGSLRPRGGLAELARLREEALALPLVGSIDLGELGRLRRIEGAVTYTRVTTDHKDALTIRPGWVVQAADAVGLVLRDAPDWRPEVGTRVRMTVAMDRGLTEINGRVRRIEERTPEELGERWPEEEGAAMVLFVSIPHLDDVEFRRTRRQAYRVPASEALRVRELRRISGKGPMPWGVDREARLVDLSAGGCAVLLDRPMEPGTLVEADLDLEGTRIPLHAEVVYAQKQAQGDDVRYRHGLHFEGLTASDHARLAREVQRRETRAIRKQREAAEQQVEPTQRPQWNVPGLS